MDLDYLFDVPQLGRGKLVILCQFNPRFKPEFRFPAAGHDIHVYSRLFPGEEE